MTRYDEVAGRILNLIHNGVLKEGDRIPSIRKLSDELGVSVNTVKEAYWKLENQNYIVAIPQSGFYVKKQSAAAALPVVDPQFLDPQEVSLCRIYGAFQNMGHVMPGISLGIAALDPASWPTEKMSRFFQEALLFQKQEAYNYIMSPGYKGLREQIARFSLSGGLNLSPEEIIITNGCHEAVFLALMSLCKPGDTVIFESPIYFNLLQLMQQLNLKIIEIPSCDRDGINLDTLRFVLENHTVNAMFSISNFNNPVGFTMPGPKKKALLKLLSEFEIPLIEDDIYGDIFYQDRPDTCKAYDTAENVLLCSSFSKTIAPGLRIGWIVPGRYYDAVLKMKTLLNISTASMNQIAVTGFLREGGYERHLRNLRKQLKAHVTAMRAVILENFPRGTTVSHPDGGFLLWVELPEEIDTDHIYQKALKKNILIAPGRLFSIKDRYSHCMRLNAGIWNTQVAQAIRYLGQLCADYRPCN